ncbi:MAG: NADP-reducing hydrogenase subunit HndC [Lentisphaerae bacterium ADurb.BinA184]|nr:MAG: NADP-reducing hydrogenase subunit HndC [Lentisphaerae bacterium ADurb.BinA184]
MPDAAANLTTDAPPASGPGSAVDLGVVDAIVARIGRGPESVIPILQALQERFQYLPAAALRRVAETTAITPAAIAGVSTFYSQFRHQPVGLHMISVCVGTACHVKGAERVYDAFRRHLRIPSTRDTDAAGRFTVRRVSCLGCCTLAPVVQVDGVTYGHVTPDGVGQVIADFLRRGEGAVAAPGMSVSGPLRGEVRIGLGSCCVAGGSAVLRQAVEETVGRRRLAVRVKRVGCVGMCHRTPLLEIEAQGKAPVLYTKVRPEDVERILLRHFAPPGVLRRVRAGAGQILERLLTDQSWAPLARYGLDVRDPPVVAFLGPQRHLATEYGGVMEPLDLDEYRARGGFRALGRCLREWAPDDIIARIKHSGLRGRGGAGFPTGVKWTAVQLAPGVPKYLVCNGDEGDPGAFMDRMILESYPYRVIEGMLIAAYVTGATEGIFYIRAEYPLALQRVGEALRRCRAAGLLGAGILGTRFSIDFEIREGAGAFVCGEETALIASLEGRRGMPRFRPPFPAVHGLHGRPTLVNNCETYALTPWILTHGPEAFAAVGAGRSKGTKVFALAGKVARGGLIEVPMGLSLRRIVEEIGGGVAGGGRLKAVQVGGPSGGCIPAAQLDLPVDYEALTAAGAMMGSGGLVVLDESDCMVDIARYFLAFTQDQSCGKCTFCRIGTKRMLELLDRFCAGTAKIADIARLEQLAQQVKSGSLCGLGRTAPNPVLTTLRYFRDEYEAHCEGRCPAHRCKALIHYRITDECVGCAKCAQHCPAEAITPRPYEKHEIDDARCVRCGTCKGVCPVAAVQIGD